MYSDLDGTMVGPRGCLGWDGGRSGRVLPGALPPALLAGGRTPYDADRAAALPNVTVTAGAVGLGWAEAVRSALG